MIEGILAAKACGEGSGIWRKHALAAMVLLVPGTWSISMVVFRAMTIFCYFR
ncbi:hypothetical protein [Desulfovibrio sp. SGI.169]|uniref:hypothetical protein n=1 Tax=Desulfovibrio sp. SGI.169 TaxID=3420561 RepID=UPI003D06B3C9